MHAAVVLRLEKGLYTIGYKVRRVKDVVKGLASRELLLYKILLIVNANE